MTKELTYKELSYLIDHEFTILDLLDKAPFLVAVSNTKGFIVRVNESWQKITGFTDAEISSKPFMSFLHPEDIERTLNHYYNGEHFFKDAKVTEGFENRYKCKKGGYAKLEWHSTGQNINGLNLSIAIFKGYEQ